MNTTIRDVENFLLAPPILEITSVTNQSIANNSLVALTFDTETVDSSNMHSTSVNPSRATAVYPGWYSTGGNASFVANATGRRGSAIAVNATTLASSSSIGPCTAAGTWSGAVRHKIAFLNAGDYLEIQAYQDSGAGRNTTVGNNYDQPGMTLVWVSTG